MLLDSWARMVKSLNVSSSVNQASRLIDGSEPCWQSSGSQGKVSVRQGHLQKRFYLGVFLELQVNFENLLRYTAMAAIFSPSIF